MAHRGQGAPAIACYSVAMADGVKQKTRASRKTRLDTVLVERGLAENRNRAQGLIRAGLVFSRNQRLDKPGHLVSGDAPLEVRGPLHQWASRGGLKLAHALDVFGLDPGGLVCLDIGASTGGFTDVLLRRGARRVYAVDVGRGQLAWALRNDPRVIVMEGVNARNLTAADISEAPQMIVCDASFIGLETVLPAALALAAAGCLLVALIKPQFEVGKGRVGKGGVVRDPVLHREVCERIRTWLERKMGWQILGLTESPIRGPAGNLEFLIAARYPGSPRS